MLSIISGFSYYFLFKYSSNHGKLASIFSTTLTVCQLLLGLLLIVSGVILVTTVVAIRQFYKKRNAADAVDTGALVRHAIAFGLFLIAAVEFNLANTLSNIFPYSLPMVYFYLYSLPFYAVTSFVSQVLLCTILWSLGTDLTRAQTPDSSVRSIYTVSVASFDEDAVLQASMWNALVRKVENEILTTEEEVLGLENMVKSSLINNESEP